jgi:hypothetical protein
LLSSCAIAAIWPRCSIRIVRCCFAIGMGV